ncbi:MAG: class I SAM-dependent methyltransferase [Candidatus Ranarchaeia archaeon]|jgi:hypothetical protein
MKKYIKNKLRALINSVLDDDSKNLIRLQNKQAALETLEFINKEVSGVRTFRDRFSLLSYAISETPETGLFMEFGVYKGETLNYIAKQTKSVVYGFDSFEGLPENWILGSKKGTFNLEELPPVRKNAQLVKGWFNETIPKFLSTHEEPCALIHIDSDLYSSAKTIFDNLKERIVVGTVIVFDEFMNYPGWKEGEFKAFMEFVSANKIEFEYLGICINSTQLAVKITGKN